MSQIHTAGDDPFTVTEAAEDKLYAQIFPALARVTTEAWPALQARTSELRREVDAGISQLARFREDAKERPEQRADLAAAFDKTYSETLAKAESLRKDSQSILDVLRAEVTLKARPRVNPEREAFVRQDLRDLLDHSPDPLKQMIDVAAGAHRDRAALVISDFADGYVERLLPDGPSRERFREGLTASSLQGSIAHGTPAEVSAALVVKETLPKVAGWVAARTVAPMARLKFAASTRP